MLKNGDISVKYIRATYSRTPAEIVGSNPTGGMDVFSVLSVMCCQVEVSATDHSSRADLPTVARRCM